MGVVCVHTPKEHETGPGLYINPLCCVLSICSHVSKLCCCAIPFPRLTDTAQCFTQIHHGGLRQWQKEKFASWGRALAITGQPMGFRRHPATTRRATGSALMVFGEQPIESRHRLFERRRTNTFNVLRRQNDFMKNGFLDTSWILSAQLLGFLAIFGSKF